MCWHLLKVSTECMYVCAFVYPEEEYFEMKAQRDSHKERQQVVLGAPALRVKEAKRCTVSTDQ